MYNKRPHRIYLPKNRKPRYPTKLNSFHPLSQGLVYAWLFNEGGGNFIWDTVKQSVSQTFPTDGSVLWRRASDDNTFDTSLFFVNSVGVQVPHNALQNPANITIFSRILPVYSLINNGQIVDKGYNSGYRCRINSTGTVSWFDRGGTNNITSNSSVTLNKIIDIAVEGSSNLKIYLDGRLDKSGGAAFGGNVTTSNLRFGCNNNNTEKIYAFYYCVYLYNRVLTANEHMALHADPYQMFRPFPLHKYGIPSAAAATVMPPGLFIPQPQGAF